MAAVACTGSATAAKDGLRGEFRGPYRMGLEETDRQKRDLRQGTHCSGPDAQGISESAVNGVVRVLKPENIQCQRLNALLSYLKYPVLKRRCHHKTILK
jgi:hypothetical protein